MQSLSEFLQIKSEDDPTFLYFLNSNFVISNPVAITPPKFNSRNKTHQTVLLFVIDQLLRRKFFNHVLTFGYKQSNCSTNPVTIKSNNTNCNYLQSENWKQVHSVIGTSKFIDILVNTSIFNYDYKTNIFTQISGNLINLPNGQPKWYMNLEALKDTEKIGTYIPIAKFLYMNNSFFDFQKLLKIPKEQQNIIFPNYIYNTLSDNYKNQIDNQSTLIVNNWKKLYKRNLQNIKILDTICPPQAVAINGDQHQLEYKIKNKDVLRFVIIILEKLIPISMFGNKANKSKIFSIISTFISLSLNNSISMVQILRKVKTTKMAWLTHLSNLSKSNFNLSNKLVVYFIWWLFDYLIPKIISIHFYATNVSSNTEIIFFRQDIWKVLTNPFIDTYFEKYLERNFRCRNHSSYLLSEFNHSKVRILPKSAKNEYRILAVPRKGADEEEFNEFNIEMRGTIKVTQKILKYIRLKRPTHFEKLNSPYQIPSLIREFKKGLLKKYKNALPKLYFMKFDIDSCYDSIPRKKLMEVLLQALKQESGFQLRSQTYYNSVTEKMSTKFSVNDTSPMPPKSNCIFIDNCSTKYFSNEDVINVIKHEIFETSLLFNQTCYLRKDGLFQGSSLSSLLVDILYDDLLQNNEIFTPNASHDQLIFRIADDFLVISTDKIQIQNLNIIVRNGFADYNAFVKINKIINASSQEDIDIKSETFQFCGIQLDINKLNVWKSAESINKVTVVSNSIKKMYAKLRWLFKIRLSYNTFDPQLNSLPIIQIQLIDIIKNITEILMISLRDVTNPDQRYFKKFIEFVLNEVIQIFMRKKIKLFNIEYIIINQVLLTMQSCQGKFQENIELLYNMLQQRTN